VRVYLYQYDSDYRYSFSHYYPYVFDYYYDPLHVFTGRDLPDSQAVRVYICEYDSLKNCDYYWYDPLYVFAGRALPRIWPLQDIVSL